MSLRISVSRLGLDHLLVEQACRAGVELRTGFWVWQPLLDGQRVYGVSGQQAQYRETVRARLVIAADGVQSTLARWRGLIQRIHWLQHVAFITIILAYTPCGPGEECFLSPRGISVWHQ
jgi:flavin-dependent dehydrogenase